MPDNLFEKPAVEKYKVSEDVALQELNAIEEEHGELSSEYKSLFTEWIRLGIISFDSKSGEIIQKLTKSKLTNPEIRFPELSPSQCQELAGLESFSMSADAKGKSGELKFQMKKIKIDKAMRFLNKVSGLAPSEIEKIKKSDFEISVVIVDFLS